MKVLWVGDAVVSSGFARCTHAACDELHGVGHEVHVLGLNYFGDPHGYPYPIYPCVQPLDGGRDGFGVTRLPHLVARLKPDVVVLLNDPWNIPAYMDSLRRLPEGMVPPSVVGWIAVDAKNQEGQPLNDLAHVVTWTEWAAQELQRGGYSGARSVVPLGVDSEVFRPYDQAEARAKAMPASVLPPGAFVVGVVGRNQPRKRLDLTIEYFAEWIRQHQVRDAYLYLHVAPTGDHGVDIRSLVRYHGLQGRVILAEPNIGHGMPTEHLPLVYSSFDAYLTTTQGEGWGLPCLEAMACGVPCIVPDWSGLGDWTGDAALKVDCTATAPSAPLNSLAYTLGGIADREQTVKALHDLYLSRGMRQGLGRCGLALARSLTWKSTSESFRAVLENVVPVAAEDAA